MSPESLCARELRLEKIQIANYYFMLMADAPGSWFYDELSSFFIVRILFHRDWELRDW